jgi:GR25 family glycosyltransferase involved in LPS biosynthesis
VDIPIKVINVRRSTERRETFIRNNAHLEYEFFEAVDGLALTEAELQDPRHFVHPLAFPSAGAYGCALSHLRLWERAIETNRPLTVAEDDVFFRRDFREASQAVISHLPPDWDFVLWGWNMDAVLSLMSLAGVTPAVVLCNIDLVRENMDAFQASTAPSWPLGLDRCFGIPAYTISPSGARRFREECFPLRNFEIYIPVLNRNYRNNGVDIAMARAYSVTKSFVAFPPLVATKNDNASSTVQPAARG